MGYCQQIYSGFAHLYFLNTCARREQCVRPGISSSSPRDLLESIVRVAEKVLQKTLERYPQLIEPGLKFLRKEGPPAGEGRDRRLDLLFSDASGRRLLVELKKGAILDRDVGQLLRYAGKLLLEDVTEAPLRKMLIGTRVAPNLRAGLEHCGVECKELDLVDMQNFLIEQGETELAGEFGRPAAPLTYRATSAVCIRVGEELLGPSTFSEVMRQLYRMLLTNRGIPPEELVSCSNPGGIKRKQRFQVLPGKTTREAFARKASDSLCEQDEFEILPVGEGTCGLTTKWDGGSAKRVIGEMNKKFPHLQIRLELEPHAGPR
jgi:hypothetical protein